MKALVALLLALCSLQTVGQGWPSLDAGEGYSFSSEWKSSKLEATGFLPGNTKVWSPKNNETFLFPWYMPRLFVQTSNGVPRIVMWAGAKVYSTNQVCLAFFSRTNLIRSYRVSDFLNSEIPFAPQIPPLQRCSQPGAGSGLVSVERADGYVLDFDMGTGREIGKEIKFRSIKFTEWFEQKMELLKRRANYQLVVGEFFGPAGGNNTVYLTTVNTFPDEKGFRQYAVRCEQPLGGEFSHGRLCWFVTSRRTRDEGEMIEGGIIRFEKLLGSE